MKDEPHEANSFPCCPLWVFLGYTWQPCWGTLPWPHSCRPSLPKCWPWAGPFCLPIPPWDVCFPPSLAFARGSGCSSLLDAPNPEELRLHEGRRDREWSQEKGELCTIRPISSKAPLQPNKSQVSLLIANIDHFHSAHKCHGKMLGPYN